MIATFAGIRLLLVFASRRRVGSEDVITHGGSARRSPVKTEHRS
jgi:hypothetical protein